MRILIIDGNNLFARAWYACSKKQKNPNAAPKSPNVGQIVALARQMLGGYKAEFLAERLYVCWDGAKDKDRLAIYPDYKKREPKPEGYYHLIAEVRELVMNTQGFITVYDADNEADDYIGLIARYYDSPRNDVFVISSDKDMYQLISRNVVVIRPSEPEGKRLYDKTVFKEKFGFTPDLFVDYYCLIGDTSDNIPGGKGIGEKTAAGLVKEFGSVESMFSLIDTVPVSARKKLLASKDDILMSKRLMTLKAVPALPWMVF